MITLALSAGLINAVAVFGYGGSTVSHVTGMITKLSSSVSSADILGCLNVFAAIFAFFAGAVSAGISTGERAFSLRKVYGCIIIAIGVLMLLPLFLDQRHSIFLLAFLMGLQNGMVVSFKGILIRSTHMTGNLTDLGVYFGYIIRGNKKEKPIAGIVPGITVLSYFIGGIVGMVLYKLIGRFVFITASFIYIISGLAYFFLQKTCTDKNFNGIREEKY